MGKLSWGDVALYENRDYLSTKHAEVTGRSLSRKRAMQIIASLKQGRDFFLAARNASDLVRPLLIYYGVLSLTRSIVIYKTGRDESSLSRGHGLTMTDFASSESTERVGIDLLAMKCKVTQGAFLDLIRATNVGRYNAMLSDAWARHRVVQRDFTVPESAVGTVISFDDVASRFSMLGGLYQDLLKRHNNAYHVNVQCLDWHTIYSVFPYDDKDEALVRQMFGIADEEPLPLQYPSPGSTLLPHYRVMKDKWPELVVDVPFIAYADTDDPTESTAIPPLAGLGNVSVLGLMFAFAYFGSMLVRYAPSAWYSLNLKLPGDAAFPILETGLETIEDNIAGYVVDEFALPRQS